MAVLSYNSNKILSIKTKDLLYTGILKCCAHFLSILDKGGLVYYVYHNKMVYQGKLKKNY